MVSYYAFYLIAVVIFSSEIARNFSENDRPVIGIIAQETSSHLNKYGTSYIVASYVKFLESAGARVVPILIYQKNEYYENLLNNINGVLFPGGGDVLQSQGYGRTGRLVFEYAVRVNDRNDYFPVWGTCLGFELLNYLVVNKLWMKACAAEDLALPVEFADGFRNSRMYRNMDESLIKEMQSLNVTINYHQWCLTPENYSVSGLDKYFKILSLNRDARNITFISSVEAFSYPFYGVVFHPEKVQFEWVLSVSHCNIPHTANAIAVSQYFANFFISEARKSKHRFPNKAAEDEALIYNFAPVFTGKYNSSTVQDYFF